MPLELFRVRPVAVANLVGFCIGGAIFGGFFLLSLYMQQVLGYSPIEAGVAFLATAGTTIPAAGAAQALITRVGVKPVMADGPRADGLRVPLVHAAAAGRHVLAQPLRARSC